MITGNCIMELSGIEKIYGSGENQVAILKGIDLCIKKGEFVALMGPSGSGKSTLLNIIGCLDMMKAIGATSREIRYLFLLDAGILGIVSSLAGIALGGAVSGAVGSLAGLPSLVTMQSITVGLLFGTVSTIVAGVYPASMAAKLDPIEALRAE